jgi:hypothetical protein
MRIAGPNGPLEIQPNFLAEQADVDDLATAVELGARHRTAASVYGPDQALLEIGVRIALGAGRQDVTGLLLAVVLRLLAAGLAMGAIGARLTMRAMRSSLFGIAASDLTMPIAAAVLLAAVARLDPVNALRQE